MTRPASVFTQKLNKPLRSPVAVGRKRTNTVQLSPDPSATETTHEPPATTAKSAAFTLDDAIPNRQNDKLPEPEFVNVTDTGSLASPTCTAPKSTPTGESDAIGPVGGAANVNACAAGVPAVPAQAKAATADSAATSLRAWWAHTGAVHRRFVGPRSPGTPRKGGWGRSER